MKHYLLILGLAIIPCVSIAEEAEKAKEAQEFVRRDSKKLFEAALPAFSKFSDKHLVYKGKQVGKSSKVYSFLTNSKADNLTESLKKLFGDKWIISKDFFTIPKDMIKKGQEEIQLYWWHVSLKEAGPFGSPLNILVNWSSQNPPINDKGKSYKGVLSVSIMPDLLYEALHRNTNR